MGPGDSPQSRLINALINFAKRLSRAVHGFAIGGGTTMLTHCDFVYAGESAKFQVPFINLALVPEFGTSYSIPARIGYLRAAELIQLGQPFDAHRAAELGLVTRVVPDQSLLAMATETAQKLAEKPASALQACKRLMRQPIRPQLSKQQSWRTRSSPCDFVPLIPRKQSLRFSRNVHLTSPERRRLQSPREPRVNDGSNESSHCRGRIWGAGGGQGASKYSCERRFD